MKNFKFLLLALPLFVASCTNDEDFSEMANTGDPYAGIKKVNAVFASDMVQGQGLQTRMATQFGLEVDDEIGLAWLGYYGTNSVGTADGVNFDGIAYQNHPLFVASAAGGGGLLMPKTSIYEGHYFSYYPYDKTTAKPGAINFDLSEQPLVTDSPNGVAAKAIYISRKNTEVTAAGYTPVGSPTTYDKAGVGDATHVFNVYPQQFSNINKIAATYQNNEPANLAKVEIKYIEVAFKSTTDNITKFTYEPTTEVDGSLTNNNWKGKNYPGGVTKTPGYYTLKNASRLLTAGKSSENFYFNSLPVLNEDAIATDNVEINVYTNYGKLTVSKAINSCFKTAIPGTPVKWGDVCDGVVPGAGQTAVAMPQSAVNTLGNSGNVIEATFDFSKSDIDGMEIDNDPELQNILRFFQTQTTPGPLPKTIKIIGTGADNEFAMSKETAELLATINASADKIILNPVGGATIALVNDGTTAVAMPKLNFFGSAPIAPKNIALRGSWNMGETQTGRAANKINYMQVDEFINYGIIAFNNSVVNNVEYNTTTIVNKPGAYINVSGSVKLYMHINNFGQITIPQGSELLVGSTLTNDATGLNAFGTIINQGTLGRIDGLTPTPVINNYGVIDRRGAAPTSKTLITSNGTGGAFGSAFSSTNKFGTIILNGATDGQYVSIQNPTEDGFIKLEVNKATINVIDLGTKANYIVVGADNTTFNVAASSQFKYVEFKNAQETKWTSTPAAYWDGVIVNSGSTVTIPAESTVNCTNAMIKGRVYKAGTFGVTSHSTYLGIGSATNIVTM